MEHKFEFDGQQITYRSGTVRDREARKLILRKLFAVCGGSDNVSEFDRETMWDYANHVTHTSPFQATWRREVGDAPEVIYEGYQLFTEAPGEAYDKFRDAQTESLMPEKKS